MENVEELREKYINGFRDLQKKHHKERENFIVLILLLAYFVDYIETENKSKMMMVAPFIPKITNIDKQKAVLRSIDLSFESKGTLNESMKEFKTINKKMITSLNNIIPQNKPKININGQNKRLIELEKDAEIIENGNKGNIAINMMVLNKKKKQWNTQRDSKVRKTQFHGVIDRQIVGINELFRANEFVANYPADSLLPNYDRFNCRCYLTYYD